MHKRTISNAPKFENRSLEQREVDARRNAPKYSREKRVSCILTAKYLIAKSTFDNYHNYNIDEAYNAASGTFDDSKDPWLRIESTLPDFLNGWTKDRVERGESVSVDELTSLKDALVRLARVEKEGAGRDGVVGRDGFKEELNGIVGKLQAEFNLPQSPPEEEEEFEEDDEE